MCVLPREKVNRISCQPRTYPCPTCGRHGRRKRKLQRKVRSLGYGQVVWLHVFYAEYRARCNCRKYFRSCPPNVCPKADYDNVVRQAVLNYILEDGLNVERIRAIMKRDFLMELSSGFLYNCLDWGLTRLHLARQRREALQSFSGVLCLDELHLGETTLLLATDPVSDRIIGYHLVKVNDQAHLRCFLRSLQHWGFQPKVVVTDGSTLYPALLQELWPEARHQLCVFHVLQDVTKKVLDAVRRLRRGQSRRGHAGRKRRRGRPTRAAQARRRRRGLTAKEKAAFVYKHRFLIVKRPEHYQGKDADNLSRMYQYQPTLAVLRAFCLEVYQLFDTEQVARLARRRRTLLLKKAEYRQVPELEQAMGLLDKEKFDKMIAFLEEPVSGQIRTNNHVERANRQLRFAEKARYKWRTQRSLDRYLRLRLALLAEQRRRPATPSAQASPPTQPVTEHVASRGGD